MPSQSKRDDRPEHIEAVAKVAAERGCDWPGKPCGRDIPEFNGRDAECVCETVAIRRTRPTTGADGLHGDGAFRAVMGDGAPCMSCGGNDGYGPAPHHKPDCYFASWEDAEHAA